MVKKMTPQFRFALMCSTMIVGAAFATPVAAQAQARSFDIPAQPVATGVATFARQAGVQILITAQEAEGKRTNAIKGAFSVEEGLKQLLRGTGLRANNSGPQAYIVVPEASTSSSGSPKPA
jgi:hypothetical protein